MAEEPRRPDAHYGPQPPAIPVVAQALRRPYEWRSEKPTQPGWYVLRLEGLSDDMAQICWHLGALMVAPTEQTPSWNYVRDIDDGLWKGPLDLENL